MRKAEYRRLYRQARSKAGILVLRSKKELIKSYKEAGAITGTALKSITLEDLNEPTNPAWDTINNSLVLGGALISEKTQLLIPEKTEQAYSNYGVIDTDYVMDAVKTAGNTIITYSGMESLTKSISDTIIRNQGSRLSVDGRTLSERIWDLFDLQGRPVGVNGDYQYRIKNIIQAGLNQGRDAIDIAKDIQVYVSRGKVAVFNPGRYGRLVQGTPEYVNRISGTVDWRALRLVRSEMHMALQQASKADGIINPACLDLYDWKKTSGNPLDPFSNRNSSGLRCIDLEDGNPYQLENVPDYQHSNCSCSVVPVLMDQRQFVEDLRGWVLGDGPPYMDNWYRTVYTQAA